MRPLLSLLLVRMLLDQSSRLDKLPLLPLLRLAQRHQEVLFPRLLLVGCGMRLFLQLVSSLGREFSALCLAFSDGRDTLVLVCLSASEPTVEDAVVNSIFVSVWGKNTLVGKL